MKRVLIFTLLLTAAPAVAASGDEDCRALAGLHELYAIRSMAMSRHTSSYDIDSHIDRRIETLREPLRGGEYRWVRWARPRGDAPEIKKGHLVVAVHDRGDSDPFEASGDHIFSVRIEVPAKRSLFGKNAPVYVGNVRIRTEVNGRTRSFDKNIGQWMNPDTSRTIDLETITDHATVSLESSTQPDHVRDALVEIHLLQAVAEDDPANPSFPAIQMLQNIRRSSDPRTIDLEIATMERRLFLDADPLPLATLITELRHADELSRSKKTEDQEKGEKLLKETLRRLR